MSYASPGRYQTSAQKLQLLQSLILPVLAQASVGNFTGVIDITDENDADVNEILMGVNVLLEEVRTQARALEIAQATLQHERTNALKTKTKLSPSVMPE